MEVMNHSKSVKVFFPQRRKIDSEHITAHLTLKCLDLFDDSFHQQPLRKPILFLSDSLFYFGLIFD